MEHMGSVQGIQQNMMFDEDRLQTYKNWSNQILQTKYTLAKAGMFYTGCGDMYAM
jgi:hypothetical protein